MMKGFLRDLHATDVLNGSIAEVIESLTAIQQELKDAGGETIILHYDDGILCGTDPELYLSYSKQEVS